MATLVIGVLLISAIWAAIAAYIVSERDSAVRVAEIEATNLSAAFEEEVSQTLNSVRRAIDVVAERMRATPDKLDIYEWAKDIPLLSAPTIQGSIVGPDGRLLSNTLVQHPEPLDLRDREHIRVQLDGRFKGLFISKPVVLRTSGRPSINVTQRVEQPDGRFLGIVVFSLAPDQLTRLHEQIDFGANGRLALIGATDFVIRAQFGPNATPQAAGMQIPPIALPADSDHVTINFNQGVVDHVKRFYAKRRVPGYDLMVSVGMALDDVLATPRVHARQIIMVGIAVTALLGGLMLLLVREIRRRGQREMDLRSSEHRLRDFAELSSDWFWEQDADLRFTNVTTGTPLLTPGDTSHYGWRRWELNDSSSAPEIWGEHRRACMNREPFRNFRYTRATPDGRLAHVSISGIPVFDEAGVFLGYRGTGRDVTAEVQAENELRAAKTRAEQAESLLRDAVDSIPEGFVIYDPDDRFVLCNEAYRRIYFESAPKMVAGNTFEEIVRYGLANGEYPNESEYQEEHLAERMRWHRAAEGEIEQRLSHDRWVLVTERRMPNGGTAGLRVDISKLKQTEIALRDSERRIRDFAETTSDWFWEQDAELRFTWISGAAPLVASGQMPRGALREDLIIKDSVPEDVWRRHQAALDAHEPFRDLRYAMIDLDGELRHASVSGVPVFDAEGRFQGYRGTGRDVTREVEAEIELRTAKERAEQAEALLRDAVDSISEGFVIYDAEERLVLTNQTYKKMFPARVPIMVPGDRFEDISRSLLAAGEFPDATGKEEEWLAERLRQHREAQGEVERQTPGGRWMLISERRMRNGGVAGLRVDITPLKQAQLALRDSEARLDLAQQIAGIGSWELDIATGRYLWSREMYRIRGLSPETFQPSKDNLVAGVYGCVHADDEPRTIQWLRGLENGSQREAVEFRVLRQDGERIVRVEGRPVRDRDGRVHKLIGTMQDVTELRLTEQKLVHAQKMEIIGQFSGGMAHDFNNVLGVIIGNLDLLGRLTKNQPEVEELRIEAREAAQRGADLSRRLLTFARRQALFPQTTEVNVLVDGLVKLLKRILGENIELGLNLDPNLWTVVVDPAQLEAALTNLAANARDAMSSGGRLDISTRNVRLDLAYTAEHPDTNPGDYVLIQVSDNGAGIAPEIIRHIFDPFFTTKETGKGSGLGLSMVFGFIRQSGGHVSVYSEPGMGSTFRLYLPRSAQTETDPSDGGDHTPAEAGHESVLVVEDDAQLRRATVQALQAFGYHVLEAENANGALDVLRAHTDVDVLFTDVVMPGAMDGLALALRATAQRPELRVLLTSGYPDVRSPHKKISEPGYRLLTKPYQHDELARALRETLDTHEAILGD